MPSFLVTKEPQVCFHKAGSSYGHMFCALVGRNISQNLMFLTCYLTGTHVENYNYTMTRHDDFIAWLRKSPLGDKSCLPQSVNWVKFLKPPVVSQPCSFTCPLQFQLITQHLCLFLVPFEATIGCFSMWEQRSQRQHNHAGVNLLLNFEHTKMSLIGIVDSKQP